MELEFQNIRIRNAVIQDAAQLAQWWNDGSVMEHAGYPDGLHTNEEEIIQKIQKETDFTLRRYIILIDDISVGEMVHHQINPRCCEIGIKICNPEYQNRGYGKQILSLFISGLFDCLGYEIIQLDTDLRNTRAQHVYESLGFQKIAVNMDSWADQNDILHSSVDYELLPQDFISYID